jgi:tRNA (guanine26-N2/guanine27-N2)-dimethyltransferase
MAADRDLAVAFARAWFACGAHDRDGWDVLAATGARGLRLLHEGEAFRSMRFTEANPTAVEVLRSNAARYPGAVVEERNSRVASSETFDYADLDPYGSPLPFLDVALSAVRPGGVIALTATDMMVLAGVQPGAAERLYGSRPVRGRLSPESGLRILLATVARRATERSLSVRPLLAYARDHYVRAYVELRASTPESPKPPVAQIDPVTWTGPELGPGAPFGPMWLGPLHSAELLAHLEAPPHAAESKSVTKFIGRLREEGSVDVPFYYEANALAGTLGLPEPASLERILAALRDAGYRSARGHGRPEAFRTDADRETVRSLVAGLSRQSQNARVRA